MKNEITFKKIEAGHYQLFLNGVPMVQYERGYRTWWVSSFTGTDAYINLLNSMHRDIKWLIDMQGDYLTKAEIKKCWESAIRLMNENN